MTVGSVVGSVVRSRSKSRFRRSSHRLPRSVLGRNLTLCRCAFGAPRLALLAHCDSEQSVMVAGTLAVAFAASPRQRNVVSCGSAVASLNPARTLFWCPGAIDR
jgi:hypothetical protein